MGEDWAKGASCFFLAAVGGKLVSVLSTMMDRSNLQLSAFHCQKEWENEIQGIRLSCLYNDPATAPDSNIGVKH